MAYTRVSVRPGFNVQATQTLNEGGWSLGNLVRFRNGLIEKLAGWVQLFAQTSSGIIRGMHAYEDLNLNNTLLLGTDGGPEIYAGGVLYPVKALVASETTVTYTPQNGNNIVTVTGFAFQPFVGEMIQFPQKTSIGGVILAAGSSTSVVSSSSGSFTFDMPSSSSNNTATSGILKYNFFYSGPNPSWVKVTFANHGLTTPGQTFTVDLTTSYYYPVSGVANYTLTIPGGTVLTASSIIDANNFVFIFSYLSGAPANTIAGATVPEGEIFNGVDPTQSAPQYYIYATQLSPNTDANWTVDNFGNFGLFCQNGGAIYQYTPPISSGAILAPVGAANQNTGAPATAPQINTGMFVSMPQAQVIAYGSEATIGGGAQDPLLIRWSDVGSVSNFIGTVTNQAGSLRLSRGSKCIGGLQAPQSSLIWTDVDLWAMAYIGVGDDDSIYSFNIAGSGCGLIAQNAACVQGRTTYWMGQKSFWMFNDSGVQAIECPLWDQIFNNLNPNFISKICAGSDSSTQEIFFFYPSTNSTGENDSYVKLNTLDNLWDYGSNAPPGVSNASLSARTAWIDESVFGAPLGADTSLLVQQQETGYDANGVAMAGAFAETGYTDLGDGTYILYLDDIIPDFKWLGSGGYVEVTIWATQTPGGRSVMYGPFPVTPTTGVISTGGIRARQMAIRIDWGLSTKFNARLGALRVRTSPAGRV